MMRWQRASAHIRIIIIHIIIVIIIMSATVLAIAIVVLARRRATDATIEVVIAAAAAATIMIMLIVTVVIVVVVMVSALRSATVDARLWPLLFAHSDAVLHVINYRSTVLVLYEQPRVLEMRNQIRFALYATVRQVTNFNRFKSWPTLQSKKNQFNNNNNNNTN